MAREFGKKEAEAFEQQIAQIQREPGPVPKRVQLDRNLLNTIYNLQTPNLETNLPLLQAPLPEQPQLASPAVAPASQETASGGFGQTLLDVLGGLAQGIGGAAIGFGAPQLAGQLIEQRQRQQQAQQQSKALLGAFPQLFKSLDEPQRKLAEESGLDPDKLTSLAKLNLDFERAGQSRSALLTRLPFYEKMGVAPEVIEQVRDDVLKGSDPKEALKFLGEEIDLSTKLTREQRLGEALQISKERLALEKGKTTLGVKREERLTQAASQRLAAAKSLEEKKNILVQQGRELIDDEQDRARFELAVEKGQAKQIQELLDEYKPGFFSNLFGKKKPPVANPLERISIERNGARGTILRKDLQPTDRIIK